MAPSRISNVLLRLLHPVNFVNVINGKFSMLSINETADLSKFIAAWTLGELCFPVPL